MLKTGESATVIIAHTGVTGAAAAVLALATAEGGRLAMVAARYIEERYLNPLKKKRIKREQEAMKKVHKAGHKAGSTVTNARWEAWNERRLAAEAKGEPFDEPTPATLRNRDRWQAAPGQDDAPPCGAEATSKTGAPLWVWGSPGRDPLWTQLTSDPCTVTHDLPIMGRMNT